MYIDPFLHVKTDTHMHTNHFETLFNDVLATYTQYNVRIVSYPFIRITWRLWFGIVSNVALFFVLSMGPVIGPSKAPTPWMTELHPSMSFAIRTTYALLIVITAVATYGSLMLYHDHMGREKEALKEQKKRCKELLFPISVYRHAEDCQATQDAFASLTKRFKAIPIPPKTNVVDVQSQRREDALREKYSLAVVKCNEQKTA